ncbi:helix-turn-helix domain-containing protein [Methylobacterium sp. J-090]|uniref:helix-turn-helix domain-containing protein n=1 Tax=Methylobacterium sp. J-090 TaxID=2836666 RepID=UPI001FBA01A1|nr:helix-turn-helix domain-containing protein [Methylobacterium sp. J-090]MCJ2084314.1 helix-turn-helix domain-containing protein [Methylobacterium sp. J-090]
MRRLEASHPYCTHTRGRANGKVTGREASPRLTSVAAVATHCLVPFNRREGLTTAEAAEQANRTERTIRMWCRDHDIGRRIAGGPWLVSRVALAMFLNDDAPSLRSYLAGDRHSPEVAAYFASEGLGELVAG